MTILLTNDDGYRSPGIHALYESLSEVADVIIVAPDRERSAVSLSITLRDPLRATPFSMHGMKGFYVDGTPADCVKLACGALLEKKPDFVFSGINLGSNVGLNSNYSGTVAAAVEGAMLKIPSVAVSLASFDSRDFRSAIKVSRFVLEKLQKTSLEPYQFLNVNVPAVPPEELQGIRVAEAGQCVYKEWFDKRLDARNREYYWMGGTWTELEPSKGADHQVLEEGYAAVAPLRVNWTATEAIDRLRKDGWDLNWNGRKM